MNFQRACTHVLYILVILACLGDFKHIIKAEEHCYRGDGLLDYENPCFGDSPEEPEELGLCTKGQRLTKNCTEVCRYCEPGTYQNTHTNCTSCLKCTTDCTPGQVIQNCTPESDTVCGCPSSPPCPACPTCSACPSCPNVTCPSVTACPSVTPCPAQPENHKDVADPLVDNNFASCQHCCIPLIVVLVIAFVAAAGAIVGYRYYKQDDKPKDIPMEENKSRMESDKAGSRSREDKVEEGSNRPSKQTSTSEEDQGGSSSRLAPLANLKEDIELEDVKVEGGDEEGSGSAEPSEGTEETDIKTPLLDKEEDKSKQSPQKSPTPGNGSEPDQTIEADGVSEDKLCSKKEEKPNSQEMGKKLNLATPEDDLQKKNTEIQGLKKQIEEMKQTIKKERKRTSALQNQDFKRGEFVRQESVTQAYSMRLTFLYLSEKLTHEWKRVGRRLKLDDEKLEQIKKDYQPLHEAIYHMFKTWRQQEGNNATFPVLMEALKKEERQDLIDHLKYGEDVIVHQP